MKILSTYSAKIKESSGAFEATAVQYRLAVGYFVDIMFKHWDGLFASLTNVTFVVRTAELLCWPTKKRPVTKYNFGQLLYKFPSYLRRAAISEAYGIVSSYQTRLKQWKVNPKGKEPGLPKAGRTFPAMYRDVMFRPTDNRYVAKIKVFIRNTWDWGEVKLRKSDVDYMATHCALRKACVPTLRRRGKNWFLDFAFEEEKELTETPIREQTIVSVDLGINNACVCSVMNSDGTVLARRFLRLDRDKDSLNRALQRIKRAQKQGNRKTPRLWAKAKGINNAIAVKTATFIMDTAIDCGAHVIVMEKLDLKGRKRGSKKQRLHHWRAQYVQRMVEDKAHRCDKRVSRVCAWNTSRLAFDGSGAVTRDEKNHSLCTFQNGKRYHCDLSASYNIGARYFVREIFKSLLATTRQRIAAKVPECAHRSTCTLSSLFRLHAELGSTEHQSSECCPHRTEAVPPITNEGSPRL